MSGHHHKHAEILHIRNRLCRFVFPTVDILVPEISVPNKSPWSYALWPLGREKLRERLQILTWSEPAQHRWQEV